MKKTFVLITVFVGIFSLLFVLFLYREKVKVVSPLGDLSKIKEKPLEKYSFENLRKVDFAGSEITIGKLLKEGNGFRSYVFYFNVNDPSTGSANSLQASSGHKRKVSGMINIPEKDGTFPVLVMFRGYVDKEKYTIGEGTRHSGEVFAQNGFITLAPDFLGYGESDKPSINSIEERFRTYTTALTLLASVRNLNIALDRECHAEFISASPMISGEKILKQVQDDNKKVQNDDRIVQDGKLCNISADVNKIGIWGHSNGGHISLSVLAISGKNYPTVLWNPVSKPFPYSILYFTDEFEDHGKALRFAVATFEKDYDIEKYSPTNYYNWINAPIQLHQAVDDESVPKRWSDQLSEELKKLEKDVIYFTYPDENHNFNNGSWGLAIQRSINFYTTEFQKPKNP